MEEEEAACAPHGQPDLPASPTAAGGGRHPPGHGEREAGGRAGLHVSEPAHRQGERPGALVPPAGTDAAAGFQLLSSLASGPIGFWCSVGNQLWQGQARTLCSRGQSLNLSVPKWHTLAGVTGKDMDRAISAGLDDPTG